MELVNAEVSHKSFGNGVITKTEDIYIYVLFDNSDIGEKKFLYPDIFKAYMTVNDPVVVDKIKIDIHEKDEASKKKVIRQEIVFEKQRNDVNENLEQDRKAQTRTVTNRATSINHSLDNVPLINEISERCIIIKINQNGIDFTTGTFMKLLGKIGKLV